MESRIGKNAELMSEKILKEIDIKWQMTELENVLVMGCYRI
ncbi:hypothetical protein ACVPOR_16915 [Staphylococcus aureus]